MKLQLVTLTVALGAVHAPADAQPAGAASPPSVVVNPPPASDPLLEPEPERDVRDTVLKAGTATFLLSYGLSIGLAAGSLDPDDKGLYVPVAGPWIALAAREPCDVGRGCERDTASKVLLATDGVIQALGAVGIVGALVAPRPSERLLVKNRSRVKVRPTTVGLGHPGIAVAGWF